MNKPKFNIGEKVKCVGESAIGNVPGGYRGAGWQKDLIFIITKISYDEHRKEHIYWRAYQGNGVYVSSLRRLGITNPNSSIILKEE